MSRWLAVLAAATWTAHAEPRGFGAAYQRGQDLFHLGKYSEARAAFERARALEPRLPGPHRWLGRIARVEERWDDCVASSTQAVRLRPDSPLVAEVREDLDACRSALGRPGYGKKLAVGQGALAVITNTEGDRIIVDGIDRGVAPVAPFPLNAGKHRIRLVGEPHESDVAPELVVDVVPGIVTDAVLHF